MRTSLFRCAAKGFIFSLLLFVCLVPARAATNKKPVLISQTASTRAVAFETVSFKAEPFPLTASLPLTSTDTRTRISIFAMDLELLPGDSSAASADVRVGATIRAHGAGTETPSGVSVNVEIAPLP